MERYEAYKDSGVEWIGEIPANWSVERIKDSCTVVAGATPKSDVAEYWDGDIPWITPADYSETKHYVDGGSRSITELGLNSCGTSLVPKGSVIVSNRAPIGLVSVASRSLCTNQGCKAVVPLSGNIFSEYLYWYLLTQSETLNSFGRGTTFLELSTQALSTFVYPCPSVIEQHAIADYLDAKTAEVDALVADCEREVGLLREYRKAVITEAVTKGLDPDAPMKDSGIEWIGEYPTSWEYLKLGYTFDRLFDIDHWMPESVNEGYPYLMIGDLEELASRIDFESCKHISEEDYLGLAVKGTPKRGDVIIARYATIGTGCFVDIDEPFIVTYACLTVTPKRESMRGRYLLYYTQSDAFERELFMLTNSNTQGNVGKDSLSKAHILLPPIDEQDEIVSALDASIGKIDKLIESKQSMADKLREYRRSLISEAVTGKFKVPGV